MQSATQTAIGLMGGTFNPIHFGHLRMAQELAESLNLDEVRFIPAANPPHKSADLISAEHRAAMVHLGVSNNPTFTVDNRELLRSGASYTVDTLLSLRDEFGKEVSLTLFMGSDAFTKFNTWHRWQEIIQLCHIALVQRPLTASNKEVLPKVLETFLHNHYTENADELHESPSGWVTMQQITALDISSTTIRDSIKNHHSVRYLMPDSVIDYIQTHKLYR
ncbi:putative nicotinate-nucleotide adenylyltransferase [mine drainage metagenome]|uniref:Putative nicotinate-nucleotide adenylyltransferase n=1 Tax=mine drainage metagenome TaxID=410659 RepID=A0A1J5S8E3_9ZZZZ